MNAGPSALGKALPQNTQGLARVRCADPCDPGAQSQAATAEISKPDPLIRYPYPLSLHAVPSPPPTEIVHVCRKDTDVGSRSRREDSSGCDPGDCLSIS